MIEETSCALYYYHFEFYVNLDDDINSLSGGDSKIGELPDKRKMTVTQLHNPLAKPLSLANQFTSLSFSLST